MPKRSNQFQKLITYIAEKVAPIGATVRESAELNEKGIQDAVAREIDVLIEADGGMAPVRIALECRDRSRKDDIQWIDDLIGKYQNLEVDQIIAVSNSGFSGPAKKKAELNGILALSLQEASETDWPEKFTKLGVAHIQQNLQVVSVQFITRPPFEGRPNLADKIIFKSQEPSEALAEREEINILCFLADINPIIINQVHEYVSSNALAIYKSLSDFDKDALVEKTTPVNDLLLATRQGNEFEIDQIIFKVLYRSQQSKVDVKRHLLSDKAMVTSAILPYSEQNDVALAAVQVGGATEAKLFLENKPKRRKRTKPKTAKAPNN